MSARINVRQRPSTIDINSSEEYIHMNTSDTSMTKLNSYIKQIEHKRYSAHTIAAYERDISQFLGQLDPDVRIVDQVRRHIVELSTIGISPRSINRKLASIKSYYKYLYRCGDIPNNPTAALQSLRVSQKVVATFSQKEMKAALDREPRTEKEAIQLLILDILYMTGIRRSELISLRYSDLDLSRLTIRIEGKGNKNRLIPVCDRLIVAILDHYQNRDMISDDLILTHKGKRLYPRYIYNAIQDTMSRVTTKADISPHMIRHTFATHLLDNGADLLAISKLLGHASQASTQVYTHNDVARLKRVYSKAMK